ncbi:MAG: hypothetical protein IJW62_04340 [Clostridia bacterium]|nr:hypothetical protein [Clostridia bacterium]
MDTEFLILYLALGIVAVLMIAVLIMLFSILSKVEKLAQGGGRSFEASPYNRVNIGGNAGGTVFCTQCATQYDASQKNCPRCGKSR